ncbi:hypothetical protein OPV22_000833 [Ensete ventricosum]|uniref:Uncharacterized protein n=1 Tax=Ensete ventricosum TaxID=4639 RepID=A0AAV8RVW2_ENSVE|nr:hypothetical protein OPV22_000833 [Ensete ventricosum]
MNQTAEIKSSPPRLLARTSPPPYSPPFRRRNILRNPKASLGVHRKPPRFLAILSPIPLLGFKVCGFLKSPSLP